MGTVGLVFARCGVCQASESSTGSFLLVQFPYLLSPPAVVETDVRRELQCPRGQGVGASRPYLLLNVIFGLYAYKL